MAVQRRASAARGSPSKQGGSEIAPASTKKAGKGGKSPSKQQQQQAEAAPAVAAAPPASSLRTALAVLALAVAAASALSEWPIYMVYEKGIGRPALAFSINLGITAIVSLAVNVSPPVRALKPAARAAAAAEGQPGGGFNKMAKRKLITSATLILIALYLAFGLFGPSGALTAAALASSMFLALP